MSRNYLNLHLFKKYSQSTEEKYLNIVCRIECIAYGQLISRFKLKNECVNNNTKCFVSVLGDICRTTALQVADSPFPFSSRHDIYCEISKKVSEK